MQAAAGRSKVAAVAPASPRPPRLLDEAWSLARLAAAGIPVVPHRLCRTPEEAVAAAARPSAGPSP